LNGLKYFEKPPLQYWFSALAFGCSGPTNGRRDCGPPRPDSSSSWFPRRLWWRWRGPDVGVLAGSMLASAWGLLLGAQILTLDIGLTLFHSIALLAFIAAHRPEATSRTRRWAMIVVGPPMACAVLSKGLVGIVLPGLALVVYAAIERDLAVIKSVFTWPGIVVFLVLACRGSSWFNARIRSSSISFFVQEHFRRYFEPVTTGRAGGGTSFPSALAFLLPWTSALPGAIRDAWNAPRQGTLRPERLLGRVGGRSFSSSSACRARSCRSTSCRCCRARCGSWRTHRQSAARRSHATRLSRRSSPVS
jgi:4-amino-4-deoxy-L-arabinose transferase-like glycosyltransferase